MQFKTLDQLSAFIDLCRKKGIQDIKLGTDGIELKLQEQTPRQRKAKNSASPTVEDKQYSEDELIFWSSAGVLEVQS